MNANLAQDAEGDHLPLHQVDRPVLGLATKNLKKINIGAVEGLQRPVQAVQGRQVLQ